MLLAFSNFPKAFETFPSSQRRRVGEPYEYFSTLRNIFEFLFRQSSISARPPPPHRIKWFARIRPPCQELGLGCRTAKINPHPLPLLLPLVDTSARLPFPREVFPRPIFVCCLVSLIGVLVDWAIVWARTQLGTRTKMFSRHARSDDGISCRANQTQKVWWNSFNGVCMMQFSGLGPLDCNR